MESQQQGKNLWISDDLNDAVCTSAQGFHYYFKKFDKVNYRLIWIADKFGNKLKFFYNNDNNTKKIDYAITADDRRFNFTYYSDLVEENELINGKLHKVEGPFRVTGESVESHTKSMTLEYEVCNGSYSDNGNKDFVLLTSVTDMGGRKFTYDYTHTNLSFANSPNYNYVVNSVSEENGLTTKIKWQYDPYQVTVYHPDNSWETVKNNGSWTPIKICYWNSQKGSFNNPLYTAAMHYKDGSWRYQDNAEIDALSRTTQMLKYNVYGIGDVFTLERPFLSEKIYREVIFKGDPANGEVLNRVDHQYYKDAAQLSLPQNELTDPYQKYGYVYKTTQYDKDGNVIKVTTYENLQVTPRSGALISRDIVVHAGDGTLIMKLVQLPGVKVNWSVAQKEGLPLVNAYYYKDGSTKRALTADLTQWQESKYLYDEKGRIYAQVMRNGVEVNDFKIIVYYKYYETGDSEGTS